MKHQTPKQTPKNSSRNSSQKSFIEILEDQIRTDLRAEIEAEVFQRLASKSSLHAGPDLNSEASGITTQAPGRDLETWLLPRLKKTVFTSSSLAQKTYAQKGSSDPHRLNNTEQTAQTKRKSTHSNSSHSTRSVPVKYTAQTVEELCAIEFLRRHGDPNLKATFTHDELKGAWRKAALKCHPDRFAQSDTVTQARMTALFRELIAAYDLLDQNLSSHLANVATGVAAEVSATSRAA